MSAGEIQQVIWFTLGASLLSTACILPPGLLLAWLLAKHQWRGKTLVETLVSLPLVLPPVATGLILLKLLGRRGPIGSFLHDSFGLDIIFTWKAVVAAIGVMSIPLLVRSARAAFESVPTRLEQMARTLGAGEWRVFYSITLPLAFRGVMAGVMLAFARGLGEFGATILVAGNIPGETTTISVAIYGLVQLGKDEAALTLMLVSLALAFGALWTSEKLLHRTHRA
jgi:molybdate transport system permease protein